MDSITELISAIWEAITGFGDYLHSVLQGIIDATIEIISKGLAWVLYKLVDFFLYLIGVVLSGISGLCGSICYATLPQYLNAFVSNSYISYFWGLAEGTFGLQVIFGSLVIRFLLRYMPVIGK